MKRFQFVVVGVVAAGLIGALLWRGFAPRTADVLSGYLEGDALYLSSPIAGAVTAIGVVDGQRVAPGVPLFAIDSKILAAQRDEARAQLGANQAQAQGAQAEVRRIRADLTAIRIQAALAARDAARYAPLTADRSGAVSDQEADRARSSAENAAAQVKAALEAVRNAQSTAASVVAGVQRARATLAEAQSRLEQLSVRAPAAGRVDRVFDQIGEWVGPNQPIISLIPDDRVKVRFFAPEDDIALYPVGARVRFHCDSCGQDRAASISYVSPQPEFTPPIIYSRKTRDRLVFLIEARPDDPKGLNPGQPVDVTPLGHRGSTRP